MQISIDQLEELCVRYDKENGCYPESEFEGRSLYLFILEELSLVDNQYDSRKIDAKYPEIYE